MIIDCVSDLHGKYPYLDGGDLLIVAGDCTARDLYQQWNMFNEWLKIQRPKYKKVVMIAGNHDGLLETEEWPIEELACTYLLDSGCEFEGLKIWGSPFTPNYYDWSFMLPRGSRLAEKWETIPEDTDILITHGPPYGILDQAIDESKCGCEDLYRRLKHLPNLKLHVFGHIHEGHGQAKVPDFPAVTFVNAAQMDRHYFATNKPIRIQL